MAKTDVLTLAILGILAETPLHGYEIRKRLGSELGPFRALSYGSLYPCLRRMVDADLIVADDDDANTTRPAASKRSRISYRITPAGHDRLKEELSSSGTSSWDDDTFDVRFSMFDRTDSATRLRILEGRRSRLTERLEEIADGLHRVRKRRDAYTTELHRHGLERVEHEVAWLDQLIENERSASRGDNNGSASAGNTKEK